MEAVGSRTFSRGPSPGDGAVDVAHRGNPDSGLTSGDEARLLRDGYWGLVVSLVTVWFGFIVIAGCGYVLAAWLKWLGLEFDLSKPMLLWLPVAIVAVTGPVWLPLAAWSERRHLKRCLDTLAERDGISA